MREYVSIFLVSMNVCAYMHVCTPVPTHVHACVCMCLCVCVCEYMCLCLCQGEYQVSSLPIIPLRQDPH